MDKKRIGQCVFQSTLPMRGETCSVKCLLLPHCKFQSTLPMRGETSRATSCSLSTPISIHSPHAGRDDNIQSLVKAYKNFNPLSPCGERPDCIGKSGLHHNFNPLSPCGERRGCCKVLDRWKQISIHSPHAGRDIIPPSLWEVIHDFNPLSPCGERRFVSAYCSSLALFQSTLPMRGETDYLVACAMYVKFQSTLPMRGETVKKK